MGRYVAVLPRGGSGQSHLVARCQIETGSQRSSRHGPVPGEEVQRSSVPMVPEYRAAHPTPGGRPALELRPVGAAFPLPFDDLRVGRHTARTAPSKLIRFADRTPRSGRVAAGRPRLEQRQVVAMDEFRLIHVAQQECDL